MKRLITEVATYSHEMFSLRFEQAGSLYQSSTSTEFFVGPIISSPFYRALDGFVRIENASPLYDLSPFRGPFSAVSDYLSSSLRAELHTLSREPSTVLAELDRDRKRLRRGQRVLEKATELCAIYPGDMQIYGGAKAPLQRFSLKLDDFRLAGIELFQLLESIVQGDELPVFVSAQIRSLGQLHSAEAASFVKKTPANGTISLIYGPASGGYPIVNYEYAIVSTKQSSSTTAKGIRSLLEWAINPKLGAASTYLAQVNFQPLPAKVEAQSVKQILSIS